MTEYWHKLMDVATSAGLGALAASARHALSKHKIHWREAAARTFAAMVTAVFAGFAAEALIEHESLRNAAIGAAAYAAPEVLAFLIRLVNKKGEELTK